MNSSKRRASGPISPAHLNAAKILLEKRDVARAREQLQSAIQGDDPNIRAQSEELLKGQR
jgi:hypothetical protein